MNSSFYVPILVLLILVLVLLIITHKGKPRMNKKYFSRHWEGVEVESNPKVAIIKADELLDEALKAAKIKGGTTGERLNNAIGFLTSIDTAWAAHKLRNQLDHEPEAEHSPTEYQKALRQYKKALKDLGAL